MEGTGSDTAYPKHPEEETPPYNELSVAGKSAL